MSKVDVTAADGTVLGELEVKPVAGTKRAWWDIRWRGHVQTSLPVPALAALSRLLAPFVPRERQEPGSAPVIDTGRKQEYRVMGGSDRGEGYAVAELTEDRGLVPPFED